MSTINVFPFRVFEFSNGNMVPGVSEGSYVRIYTFILFLFIFRVMQTTISQGGGRSFSSHII